MKLSRCSLPLSVYQEEEEKSLGGCDASRIRIAPRLSVLRVNLMIIELRFCPNGWGRKWNQARKIAKSGNTRDQIYFAREV